ncbi:uncharacterized protein PAC_20093 [Phialocephala subalpina]|uniref:1,3-beta-glucanosyltransferase n=1 Tax=Phialocephala subalpina TaxID=576137 RepID=A0A1L7XYP3_9HELO|nr:uncharacterized protein PAC_20093 [Phialocephala subalpina]
MPKLQVKLLLTSLPGTYIWPQQGLSLWCQPAAAAGVLVLSCPSPGLLPPTVNLSAYQSASSLPQPANTLITEAALFTPSHRPPRPNQRLRSTTTVLLGSASAALDPIVTKARLQFTWGLKTGYTDPLADTTSCKRDIPLLQKAGANTIRTYAIDPTKDLSVCMGLLDAAGIYVISDLGEPNTSINREDPEWNVDLLNRYTSAIESLANYTNTIGFFAGNEVPNNLSYTGSSAFVKAAVRDTKAYIKAKGYHAMGVGYAADNLPSVRANVAAYFNCGPSEDAIDFWGYNIYEWCGNSDYVTSRYKDRYGRNTPCGGAAGRKFTEIPAIYGSNMTEVFSGGIVYKFFQEENDYGLASVDGSSSTLADCAPFSSQLNAAKPTGVNSASYSPSNSALACPTVASTWDVAPTGRLLAKKPWGIKPYSHPAL